MNLTGNLREAPERLADFLERREALILCAVAVFCAAGMFTRAAMKPLWFDELATLYLARIASMAELLRALASGADANPPLYYILMRAIHLIFGEGQVAMRLLSMLGFSVMAGSIYLFTKRSSGILSALVAMSMSLGTTAFAYSFEARPYAPVLGCCGLAMLFWQRAAEVPRRKWALWGLAASLGLAVSLHYYAIFLLVPFLFAEALRWTRRRKIDVTMLGTIVTPGLLSIAYLPMALSGARHLTGCGEWGGTAPGLFTVFPMAYAGLLPSAAIWIGLGAALLGIAKALEGAGSPEVAASESIGPPAHEWVLAAALALLPFWIVFGTMPLGLPSNYISGYSMSGLIGISILTGFLARGGGLRRPAAVLGTLFLAHFAAHQANAVRLYWQPVPPADAPLYRMVREHPGLPVVLDWEALRLMHYGPPDIKGRIVALRDPELAHNVQCMVTLAPYAPVPFQEYRRILSSHNEFLLWTTRPSRTFGALATRLRTDGFHADWLATSATAELHLVTRH